MDGLRLSPDRGRAAFHPRSRTACAPARIGARNRAMNKEQRKAKFELGELEGEVLDKLSEAPGHRHRDALRNAVAAAHIRYAGTSNASETMRDQTPGLNPQSLNVAGFTALVHGFSWGKLKRLNKLGIPNGLQEFFSTMPLHKFWHDCHEEIREKAPHLGHRYFSEVSGYFYPQGEAIHAPYAEPQLGLFGNSIRDESQLGRTFDGIPSSAVAKGAAFNKVKTVVQNYLFVGLKRSEKRRQEGTGNITLSVNLYIATSEGDDFFLEVWVCSEIGKQLSEASMRPIDDLKDMLGDWLFDGLESSHLRQQERVGRCAGTRVLQAFCDGKDYRLLLPMSFDAGMKVYNDLYLSVLSSAII